MRIAISGLTGCGNTTVSHLVAEQLHLKRFNYTFKNMAKEKNISLQQLHLLAQKNAEFDYALDKKQAQFALENDNSLVASRLAVFLDNPKIAEKLGLKEAPCFDLKVWLNVPLEVRALRKAGCGEVAPADSVREVKWRDDENTKRYKKLYAIDYSEIPKGVLILDNSQIPPEKAADLIVREASLLKKGWC
ncbi:MAG: cytidylate kinase family protein [Candidatus Micrarchaeota archaeon]